MLILGNNQDKLNSLNQLASVIQTSQIKELQVVNQFNYQELMFSHQVLVLVDSYQDQMFNLRVLTRNLQLHMIHMRLLRWYHLKLLLIHLLQLRHSHLWLRVLQPTLLLLILKEMEDSKLKT